MPDDLSPLARGKRARGRVTFTLPSFSALPFTVPPGFELNTEGTSSILNDGVHVVLRQIDAHTYEVLRLPLTWRERLLLFGYKVDYQIGRAWRRLMRLTR